MLNEDVFQKVTYLRFFNFFFNAESTGSRATMSMSRFFVYLQNIVKVSVLSFSLSLLCLLFLVTVSMLMIGQFLTKLLLISPLEYLTFLFSFKLKSYRLKTLKNKENVLFIIPWMIVGGAEKTILNIAEAAGNSKFSFHIITTFPMRNSLTWYNEFEKRFQNIVVPNRKMMSLYYAPSSLGCFN